MFATINNWDHFSFHVPVISFAFTQQILLDCCYAMSRNINLDDRVCAGYQVCKRYLSANECFRCFKRESCEKFHSNSASFLVKSLNVAVCAEILGVKGDMYVAIPENFSYVAFFEIFICRMVSVRSGSGCTPSASKTRPKKLICVCLISHFTLLMTMFGCVSSEYTYIIGDADCTRAQL